MISLKRYDQVMESKWQTDRRLNDRVFRQEEIWCSYVAYKIKGQKSTAIELFRFLFICTQSLKVICESHGMVYMITQYLYYDFRFVYNQKQKLKSKL